MLLRSNLRIRVPFVTRSIVVDRSGLRVILLKNTDAPHDPPHYVS